MSALELGLSNLAAWSAQVAVLALAAGVLARLAPIERPEVRLAVGQALLLLVVALPPLQPWRSTAGEVGWSIALAPPGASRQAALGGPLAPSSTPAWAALVASALAVGLCARALLLARRLARLRTLRRRARAWEAPPWLAAVRDELAPRARFIVSDEVAAPATCGLRRPLVLLPRSFTAMDRPRQEAIATHELLHARRGDWLASLLEELLKTLLFFHPAVHWLVGRVRLAREQAVDAAVVRRLGARDVYLEALVEAARAGARARVIPAAPFLRESHLRERVELLLKEVAMSRARTLVHLCATATAILLAVSWAVSASPLYSSDTPTPALRVETASFDSIEGDVQVRRAGTLEWAPATRTLLLHPGDQVRTDATGSASIRFADAKLLSIQPASLVRIEAIAPKPATASAPADEKGNGARVGTSEAVQAPAPRILRKANPSYPPDAKAEGVQGLFEIDLTIQKDGTVRDPHVVASAPDAERLKQAIARKGSPEALQGDARLGAAAVDAVKTWVYEPVKKDGQPVEARATVTVDFRLY